MKAMIWLQKLMVVLVGIYGFLTMFSETPIEQGLMAQLWATLGGAAILVLCALWIWLIGIEEDRFIHEAR